MTDRRTGRAAALALALLAASPLDAAEPAFVGLQIKGVNADVAAALGIARTDGALVSDVAVGGPGAVAGIRRGDLILSFAGKDIDTFARLVAVVGGLAPGVSVPVTVLRAAREVKLTLTTGARPEAWNPVGDAVAVLPDLGLTMAAVTEKVRAAFGLRWETHGVLVTLTDVVKSEGTDLKRGDVIVQINQKDVWEPGQVVAAYREAKTNGRTGLLMLFENARGFHVALLPVR